MNTTNSSSRTAVSPPLRRLLACAVFLLPASGWSEDAVTDPRGFYLVKVAGTTTGESQKRTYLGVQLATDTRFADMVVGVSGNAFTLQNLSSPQDIQDPTRSYYVHVVDGNGRGFISDIVEFRQNDLRCAVDLAPWMEFGTRVRIRPHLRIVDLFGADNKFSLTSGPSAESADNVVAWDTVAQQEKVYYYHSVRQRWEEKDVSADAGSALLRFPYGIYIIRRSSGNLRMTLSGDISDAPILLPVRPGVNVFSLPINLSSSLANLIPESGDYPVIAGINATQGDLITLEEPYSGLQKGPFYLSSRPGSIGWRKVGANADDETIEPLDYLSTLIIRRNGPAGFVRVEGSLDPGPGFLIPADPDPGEVPLMGELRFPGFVPPEASLTIEVSTNLQNWTAPPEFRRTNNVVTFPLPAGQGRAFYRLRATPSNF